MTAKEIQKQLESLANPEKKVVLQRFFKTGKGEYGEGDVFMGVTVPQIRQTAQENRTMPFAEVETMLKSPIHEMRMCALLVLVDLFQKTKKEDQKPIVDFYLSNTQYINNWDLVDLSCYKILGTYLQDKPRNVLYRLANSATMWEQRISIVSTLAFIRKGDFKDTLAISERLLSHPHDLMHKAVGWMLREVAKKDEKLVLEFIQKHYSQMPRTALRYAIERLPEEKRKQILQGKFEL